MQLVVVALCGFCVDVYTGDRTGPGSIPGLRVAAVVLSSIFERYICALAVGEVIPKPNENTDFTLKTLTKPLICAIFLPCSFQFKDYVSHEIDTLYGILCCSECLSHVRDSAVTVR